MIDPPSNDYDPRRNCIVRITLDTNLVPLATNAARYFDSGDGPWLAAGPARRDMDAYATGSSATSPVGWDTTSGLIATLRGQLQSNASLGASTKNTGVLIAINTVPKFGNPVDGQQYESGQALPYGQTTGLGGAQATAGWVLPLPSDVPPTIAMVKPAAGQVTLTLSAAITATQTMAVRIKTRRYAVLFAGSHDATLQALAAQLATDPDVASSVVTVVGGNQTGSDDRVITLTAVMDPPPATVPRTLTLSGSVSPGNAMPNWTLSDPLLPPGLVPVPAAGLEVFQYRPGPGSTPVNIQQNTTYYFKVWAYDNARNYSRGMEGEATTVLGAPIRINEFNTNGGNDWVEFSNPSGQAIDISGYILYGDTQVGSTLPVMAPNPARSYLTLNPSPVTPVDTSGNVRLFQGSSTVIDQYEKYTRDQITNNTEGRVWDGGPRGKSFDYSRRSNTRPAPRFESVGGLFRGPATNSHGGTQNTANNTQSQAPAKYFQATANHVTRSSIYLHYTNLGEEPAVWRYSPKQQDFHPISIEGMAVRSQTEIIVGLRSPLSNRTTGFAYAFVFTNAADVMFPTTGWTGAAGGFQSLRQLNLNGQGIRSVQWCPAIRNVADPVGGPATGAYLIVGGAANGGPLKNETSRQKFSLYRWDNVNAQPVQVVEDLSPYATRPEGVNVITLNGQPRLIFVEDRFKAEGYDTKNGVHWPLSTLNLQ